MVKSAADFLGEFLGQSEVKTKAILASTVGKVLIIDEAYLLHPPRTHGTPIDIYKVAIIDTLVAEIQSTPGEDRCVLLLGYDEEVCHPLALFFLFFFQICSYPCGIR